MISDKKVIAIIPTADRQKATVKVRVGFDQLDPRILPDMGVKVTFLRESDARPGSALASSIAPYSGKVSRSAPWAAASFTQAPRWAAKSSKWLNHVSG